MSGRESLRTLWEKYYDDLDGIIYMIDCTGKNIEKSVNILSKIFILFFLIFIKIKFNNNYYIIKFIYIYYIFYYLTDNVLASPMIQKVDIPIMILINKIDLLELDKDKIKIIYNSIDYKKVTQKHFIVKDISALKKVRLEESINWLYNSIMNDNKEEEENYSSNLV